ncbi:penicillin-insensitive murein endopeptidase [Ancylobacter sp. FA202]|uniref:penicillin-insensitive murein endopeptidase n=1 Tax=Ancylobacter sp. FA202 TaxID=1111106 RepID=UPI000365ACDC|nr:penicillin-insensitive murein endopeptidase [Ancylobacter sp. FA202]
MRRVLRRAGLAGLALLLAGPAAAQTAPAARLDSLPAKQVFGAAKAPAPLEARSIGFYSKGCLAGAQALPVNGATWQAMRLSRNRNWGHPNLIAFLERFSATVPSVSQWPGILVGDLSQPRGGPMLTGHASHQIGLDADIWLTPMPRRELSREEREKISATMVVRKDRRDVDPAVWTPSHITVIKAAAQDPEVERVLVNAAIKKALCRDAKGDRAWLQKVRPYWGHDYHMHVRLSCPEGAPDCRPQDPVVPGEGCGAELDWWFSEGNLNPKPPTTPPKPKPPMLMQDLPEACRQVVLAP